MAKSYKQINPLGIMAAMVTSAAAMMGGCSNNPNSLLSYNKWGGNGSEGVNSSVYSRTDVANGGVNWNTGTTATIGGDGKPIGGIGVKGVDKSAGVNNRAVEIENDINRSTQNLRKPRVVER